MFYGPCFMFDVSSMSALGTDQPGSGPLSLSLPTTTNGQLGTVLHQPIPAPLNDRAQNQVLPFHLIWEQVGRTWWTWEGMG